MKPGRVALGEIMSALEVQIHDLINEVQSLRFTVENLRVQRESDHNAVLAKMEEIAGRTPTNICQYTP